MPDTACINKKSAPPDQQNMATYNDVAVVDYYAQLRGLEPYEQGLFERHIVEGARILDIGVGGGRTTPWLAGRASSYLGIDYSLPMVDACQRKFPQTRFVQMDATDMSAVTSASVDAVVFSFNGIDYIHPPQNRTRCLREVSRVLAPGGLFIFSEHNARHLIVKPRLRGADLSRRVWRSIRAVILTVRLCAKRVLSPVFRAGYGYETDPVHGGLITYTVTPATICRELLAAGFELVEHAGVNWPARSHPWVTPWYYYVARKIGTCSGLDAS